MDQPLPSTLQPVSDEDIAKKNISLSDLWMIKMPDESIHGPFTTLMLKQSSNEAIELFKKVYTYNLENESWKKFFSTPQFQRRQPRLVPTQSLISDHHFHILIQGKKQGPYQLDQLQQMVQNRDVNLNTLISSDDGESWIKLYEHHHFDRRSRQMNRDSLPFVPHDEIFKHVHESTQNTLKNMKKTKDEEDALVGLAFIGHGNDKGQLIDNASSSNSSSMGSLEGEYEFNDGQHASSPSSVWSNFIDKCKEFLVTYPKLTAATLTVFLISFVWLGQENKVNRDIASEFKKSQRTHSQQKSKLQPLENRPSITKKSKRITARKKAIRRPKKIARKSPRGYTDSKVTNKKESFNRMVKDRAHRAYKRPTKENFNDNDEYYNERRDEDVNSPENYEMVDVEDPRVREELKREFAGDYMPELDDPLPVGQDFIERLENADISPEMEVELERRIEHFEEVSDFE